MSGSLSAIMAAGMALLASGAAAQQGVDPLKSAAEAAIRRGSIHSLADACFAAAETDANAVTLDVERLPASRLVAGAAVATRANPVALGAVAFGGEGIVVTSSDPRFDRLIVDPIGSTPRFPDGRRLIIWNLVHAQSGGQCRLALHDRGATRGWPSLRAADAGAHPELPGYAEVASWPFGYNRFIGLMRSDETADRTRIVTFASGEQHDTQVLADVPSALQAIMVQPPLHGGLWTLQVIGRQTDGSIVAAHLATEAPSR